MNPVLTDQPLVTGGRAAEGEGGWNNINNTRRDWEIKARGDVHLKAKVSMKREQRRKKQTTARDE